jgi:hypothetical protein
VSRARLFHENGIEIHFMHSILHMQEQFFSQLIQWSRSRNIPSRWLTMYPAPASSARPVPVDEQVQRYIIFHREWRHQGPEMISRSADARAHARNCFTRQVIRKNNKPPAGLLP